MLARSNTRALDARLIWVSPRRPDGFESAFDSEVVTVRAVRAVVFPVAATGDHVCGVIRVRPRNQVGRVDAGRIVARVSHNLAGLKRSELLREDSSSKAFVSASGVSLIGSSSAVLPAAFGSRNHSSVLHELDGAHFACRLVGQPRSATLVVARAKAARVSRAVAAVNSAGHAVIVDGKSMFQQTIGSAS